MPVMDTINSPFTAGLFIQFAGTAPLQQDALQFSALESAGIASQPTEMALSNFTPPRTSASPDFTTAPYGSGFTQSVARLAETFPQIPHRVNKPLFPENELNALCGAPRAVAELLERFFGERVKNIFENSEQANIFLLEFSRTFKLSKKASLIEAQQMLSDEMKRGIKFAAQILGQPKNKLPSEPTFDDLRTMYAPAMEALNAVYKICLGEGEVEDWQTALSYHGISDVKAVKQYVLDRKASAATFNIPSWVELYALGTPHFLSPNTLGDYFRILEIDAVTQPYILKKSLAAAERIGEHGRTIQEQFALRDKERIATLTPYALPAGVIRRPTSPSNAATGVGGQQNSRPQSTLEIKTSQPTQSTVGEDTLGKVARRLFDLHRELEQCVNLSARREVFRKVYPSMKPDATYDEMNKILLDDMRPIILIADAWLATKTSLYQPMANVLHAFKRAEHMLDALRSLALSEKPDLKIIARLMPPENAASPQRILDFMLGGAQQKGIQYPAWAHSYRNGRPLFNVSQLESYFKTMHGPTADPDFVKTIAAKTYRDMFQFSMFRLNQRLRGASESAYEDIENDIMVAGQHFLRSSMPTTAQPNVTGNFEIAGATLNKVDSQVPTYQAMPREFILRLKKAGLSQDDIGDAIYEFLPAAFVALSYNPPMSYFGANPRTRKGLSALLDEPSLLRAIVQPENPVIDETRINWAAEQLKKKIEEQLRIESDKKTKPAISPQEKIVERVVPTTAAPIAASTQATTPTTTTTTSTSEVQLPFGFTKEDSRNIANGYGVAVSVSEANGASALYFSRGEIDQAAQEVKYLYVRLDRYNDVAKAVGYMLDEVVERYSEPFELEVRRGRVNGEIRLGLRVKR